MVTDYDAWREEAAAVDVAQVLAQVGANTALARETVRRLLLALPEERPGSPIDTVLDQAIITPPHARASAMIAKLDAVAGRAFR
jgi:5'-methylthioadenosine phosphorylase